MKTKTSMKICHSFNHVFSARYCDLQDIFKYHNPQFYNCGVYGWNCDLYVDYKHDTILTTGYRNMRGKLIPSELIEKYSKRANDIRASYDGKYSQNDYDSMMIELDKNIDNFLDELTA